MRRKASAKRTRGSVRIIAGRWRGRRLHLAAGSTTRPTSDRIRATLFNWLMPVVEGARCLDLFAGTGALGIEALSRGAAEVWFVEQSPEVVEQLQTSLVELGAENDRVVIADALSFLSGRPRAFDIVFLDPPFQGTNLENLCTLLEGGWLAPGARIYLELSRQQELPVLPSNWRLVRDKTAGHVRFALAERG